MFGELGDGYCSFVGHNAPSPNPAHYIRAWSSSSYPLMRFSLSCKTRSPVSCSAWLGLPKTREPSLNFRYHHSCDVSYEYLSRLGCDSLKTSQLRWRVQVHPESMLSTVYTGINHYGSSGDIFYDCGYLLPSVVAVSLILLLDVLASNW